VWGEWISVGEGGKGVSGRGSAGGGGGGGGEICRHAHARDVNYTVEISINNGTEDLLRVRQDL